MSEEIDTAKYGTGAFKMARKRAAQEEKAFGPKAGRAVGIEMWRIEQIGKEEPAVYGLKKWPKEEIGNFYAEDAYILMNTYQSKETDKLANDIHVWEGKDATQEEKDLANSKAITLFDLLDEVPVLHKEVQAYESALFQGYFEKTGVHYLEGDLSAGFWHVKLEDFKPRLSVITRGLKTVRVTEILPLSASSLTQSDVFIMDCGRSVYLYPGKHCSAFAKMKGASLVQNMIAARQGKSKAQPEVDEEFWQVLGGTEDDVQQTGEQAVVGEEKLDDYKCTLYEYSFNDDGQHVFTSVAEGKLREAHLTSKHLYVVDALAEIFVWVGQTKQEEGLGTKFLEIAQAFIKEHDKPVHTPVTRLVEGQRHAVFGSLMMPKAQGGITDMNRYKKEAAKVEAKSTPLPQQKKLF